MTDKSIVTPPNDDQQEAAVVLHLFTYLILKTELLSDNGHEILSKLFRDVEDEYQPLYELLLQLTNEYRVQTYIPTRRSQS
tara:strand:- start:736 stop:978 length:243 start_codon:yes stop_codon:yes gene_type:complete